MYFDEAPQVAIEQLLWFCYDFELSVEHIGNYLHILEATILLDYY